MNYCLGFWYTLALSAVMLMGKFYGLALSWWLVPAPVVLWLTGGIAYVAWYTREALGPRDS